MAQTCTGTTKTGNPCKETRGLDDDGRCYRHPVDGDPPQRKLTEKQRRFVEAYMGAACGNATEAALLAGYGGDEDSLRRIGSENLSKLHIRQAIRERIEECEFVATRQERQAFWTSVMQSPKTKMRDRLKASELLGKAQLDFVERVEHTGPDGEDICYKVVIPGVTDADD